ncbi:MAG: DUF3808 domain-containing protein [Calditrichaeota bacterium]|nr:DUF3808 domain-containing protein [Calditrichota bacterium]
MHFRWTVVLIGWLAGLSTLLANHYVPAPLDELILTGKNYLYHANFHQARQTFLTVQQQYPDYPHGYFYTAYMTLLVYSQNLSNDSLRQALEDQISLAQKVAAAFRKKNRQNPDAIFHQGLIFGLKGVLYVLDRSYLRAYWFGRKAIRYLEEVARLDPDYNDTYLGLGLFHYYVDLLPRILRFVVHVLGFEGDRVLGKQELQRAVRGGHYFREEARLMYILFTYFMEGEMQQSIAELKRMAADFPENPIPQLLLGYHYRRTGKLKQALEIFQQTPEIYPELLPQMVNIKYYNMAVIHFEMNRFDAADSLLDYLIRLPTRKSIYYQAAIHFYKGLIADLRMDRPTAEWHYAKIPRHKQSKYWYNAVQMYRKHPMDSLMKAYVMARNLYLGLQFAESLERVEKVLARLHAGVKSTHPDLPYLVRDLQAIDYFFLGKPRKALELYAELIPEISRMEDKVRKSWIYIRYARVLYSTGRFKEAAQMLDRANDVDDDYTHLIVKREEIIMERKQAQGK